jgi:hypothetical protein
LAAFCNALVRIYPKGIAFVSPFREGLGAFVSDSKLKMTRALGTALVGAQEAALFETVAPPQHALRRADERD